MNPLPTLQEVSVNPTPGSSAIPLSSLNTVFGNVISVFLGFAGIVLFVVIVLSGFSWITAGGDPKKVEAAKLTLTYAVGGMVLVAMALLIMRFLGIFTGSPITTFNVVR
jgi:hypothetical protein